jgi:hypothetical protein
MISEVLVPFHAMQLHSPKVILNQSLQEFVTLIEELPHRAFPI